MMFNNNQSKRADGISLIGEGLTIEKIKLYYLEVFFHSLDTFYI